MSKFTSQEVANLENGGNERAREIYFKDWDLQRQSLPDSSNVDRLRDFIKSVYVEKRFSGERPLARGRGGDLEESRRPEPRPSYRTDSKSPPYEDRYEDRQQGGRRSNYGYEDRRYEERGSRYDEKRSPGRFDTDRNRYDRSYNDNRRYDERARYESRDRHYEDRYYEDRYNEGLDRRFEERFANERRNPQSNRDHGGSSPPPIHSVKEILGEDVPPLRVEEPGNHSNGAREPDRSHRSQDARPPRFGSSSSFGSVDGNVPVNAPVIKRENSGSLIDFLAEPEAPVAREQLDPFGLTAAVQPSTTASSSTGWATFDMFSTATAAGPPAPTPVPVPAPAQVPALASALGALGGLDNLTTQTNGSAQWAPQWPSMQSATAHAPPSFESSSNSWASLEGPISQPSISAASSQPWSPFSTSPASIPEGQLPASQTANSSSAGVSPQVLPAQSNSRQEIPETFFAGSQTGAPLSALQYASFGGMTMLPQVGNYGQPQKSKNPFDFPGDNTSRQAAEEFPSMSPLQAALPGLNMGPMSMPGPGSSAYGPQWNHTNTMFSPAASYAPAIPSGAYVTNQQIPNAMPQTIRTGPVGPSMGVGMPGAFMNAPKQGTDYFYAAQGAPPVPSQSSFGIGQDHLYTMHGGNPALSFQKPLGQAGGSAANSDFLFNGQVGQQLMSQGSLGSLSSMPGTHLQSSQFPTHSSLGPIHNPFG